MGLENLFPRAGGLSWLVNRSLRLVAVLIGISISFWGCNHGQASPACARPTTLAAPMIAFPTGQQTASDLETTSKKDVVAEPDETGSTKVRRMKQRLLTVAIIGGVLLLLLAFAYGYLRLELTTRGFYSGRLQIVSGIASLSVVTAAYFLWRWLVNV